MLKLPYFYVYFIDEINFVNSIFHYIKCKLLNCKVAERAYEVLPPAHCRLTGRLADRHYFQFSISIILGHTLLFPTLIFISDPEDRGNKVHKRKRRLIYPSWTGHKTCIGQTSFWPPQLSLKIFRSIKLVHFSAIKCPLMQQNYNKV